VRENRWAAITQRDLSETLADALSIVLTPVHVAPKSDKPVSSLPDEKVLALCELKLEPEQGKRLTQLLERQRESVLAADERREMLALSQIYHRLWIRQSEALAEAVRRGLRSPLPFNR
jgi:uncharacterized lipoprotein YmbA